MLNKYNEKIIPVGLPTKEAFAPKAVKEVRKDLAPDYIEKHVKWYCNNKGTIIALCNSNIETIYFRERYWRKYHKQVRDAFKPINKFIFI
jgi:hypothetical protein